MTAFFTDPASLYCEPFGGTLDEWGESLAGFADREIFQTPAWLRFLAESQHADPVILAFKDGSQTVGYFAGLMVRRAGFKILGSPFVGWSTERMGVRLLPGVSKRAAVEALSRYAFNRLGCMHIELSDFGISSDDVAGLEFHHALYHSSAVDLTADEDVIFARMSSKSCRYCIRKAEKLGVTIEEAHDEGFADDYYAQLCDVFAKQGLVPTYGKERVRLLIRHLLPTGNLLLLRAREPQGRCIATGIFLGWHEFAYFWGNASWRQDQHFCPNEAIHWHAVRYWKRRGMRYYDFCGGGLYKRKYGGEAIETCRLWKSRYRWITWARNMAQRGYRFYQQMAGMQKRMHASAESDEPPADGRRPSLAIVSTNVARNNIWPDGKRFAFTVFDDTDFATLRNVQGVYSFLADCGIRTTKSVWVVSGDPSRGSCVGQTCDDPDYLRWVLELQSKGFEIAFHNCTWHGLPRDEIRAALERFTTLFGHDSRTAANHTNVEESMYWGDARLTGWRARLYNVLTRFQNRGKYRGHVEGDAYFWGDLCRQKIKYYRNFTFHDINTLKACPFMPYHDPLKPFVKYWFASSEGPEVQSFNRCLSEANQDRLEEEGGACIMYAHLASGFYRDGQLNPRFQQLMTRLAQKNGWFVPVATLLDHLLRINGNHEITKPERSRLERRWLRERVFAGTS